MKHREKLAQVHITPEIAFVEFGIDDTEVSAALPPGYMDNDEFVVGIEETRSPEGDAQRKYLKIPKKLREAGHVAVEYYESHDNLRKGAKIVSIAAGAVAVGSLVVIRIKNRPR